ncbi:MAG TPA: S41 family peptidase [Anaerolineales bacterium]|nr:S41 family peptidase [Anaerolineales bacterium]
MNSKPLLIIISAFVVLGLIGGACSAGYLVGRAANESSTAFGGFPALPGLNALPSSTAEAPEGVSTQDLDELFVPFWQTWSMVEQEFVDQPVDREAMMRGAIRGMLDSLGDEHTSYLDPEMFERANAQLEGEEYEGIGAWVDTTGDYLTIISPMPNSPAEKADLKPNDKIIAVDGEDMTGIDGELVRQRVIGPKGSKVILTILRDGQEPFDVEIQRAGIIVPTVDSRILEGNIAYVELFTFGADTAKDLREVLEELMSQNPKGLILDLRNNGGGYLDTAIEVVSEFIPDGIVMFEEYGDGRKVEYEARKGGLATDIPLVILINEGSASASEIVAGAIQDTGRGLLVGNTSFGKGSVQSYSPLENNQGAVRITIARWLTPSGRQIHGEGLEPDYKVEFTPEDMTAGIDPQLEKAIELLTSPD